MTEHLKVRLEFLHFPYVFWLKKTKEEAELIDSKSIKVDNTVYTLKPFAKYKYILLKYIPVIILFITVLNRNDFEFSLTKMIEIISGLTFSIMLTYVNRKKIIALLAVIFWILIAIAMKDGMIVSFSLKYFILCYVLLQIYIDFKSPKTIYEIRDENNTLLSHLTNYERIPA